MAWSLHDSGGTTSYASRTATGEKRHGRFDTLYAPSRRAKTLERGRVLLHDEQPSPQPDGGGLSLERHLLRRRRERLSREPAHLPYLPAKRRRRRAGNPPRTTRRSSKRREAAAGTREKYRIYRRSADSLLISLGIFKNARLKRPDSAPHLAMSDAAHIGRGKSYYAIARAYAAQVHRRNTAVGDVLGKLSDHFERYLGVLSLMGGEHLNIFKQLSDGRALPPRKRASPGGEERGARAPARPFPRSLFELPGK